MDQLVEIIKVTFLSETTQLKLQNDLSEQGIQIILTLYLTRPFYEIPIGYMTKEIALSYALTSTLVDMDGSV